jgi:circadian clock protein KaiC
MKQKTNDHTPHASRVKKNIDFTDKLHNEKTGLKGFDALFHKGVPSGSSIIVEGGPGSGKTTFALQLLYEAVSRGKKALYMSFEEPEYRLRHHMKQFGWDPEKFEKSGLLRIKRFNALDVARSVEALLSEAKHELLIEINPVLIPEDFKPDIICLDSLTAISSAFSGEKSRFRIYMEQLFRYLESHHINSYLIREVPHPTHTGTAYSHSDEAVSFLSDGIIAVYNVFFEHGKRGRALEILKMRGDDIKRKIVELEIVHKKGVIIRPDKMLKGNYKLT